MNKPYKEPKGVKEFLQLLRERGIRIEGFDDVSQEALFKNIEALCKQSHDALDIALTQLTEGHP